MRIEIEKMVITNDSLDNRNFVEVLVVDEMMNQESVNVISLDDLMSALEAFDKQRKLDHERDKRYES